MQPFRDLPASKASLIRDLLRHKRTRDQERAFVLEGSKPVREVLERNNASVLTVVVTASFMEKCDSTLKHTLEKCSRLVYACRARVFEKMADVITPSGILAVVRQPEWDQHTILRRPEILGMYGECIQDPANVGAIIRTAAAFGMDGVWLSRDSADVFNSKVVRATTGTLLRMPVFMVEDPRLLLEQECVLLASQPQGKGSRPIQDITDLPGRVLLAFGNESRGLSAATLRQAAIRFHIPIAQAVESLNVAASAAIAAFYFRNLARGTKKRDE